MVVLKEYDHHGMNSGSCQAHHETVPVSWILLNSVSWSIGFVKQKDAVGDFVALAEAPDEIFISSYNVERACEDLQQGWRKCRDRILDPAQSRTQEGYQAPLQKKV